LLPKTPKPRSDITLMLHKDFDHALDRLSIPTVGNNNADYQHMALQGQFYLRRSLSKRFGSFLTLVE